MSKIRLSHTAAQMYLESSMKYFLHYIKKIRPAKIKSAFVFGKALDEAFNILLLRKDVDAAHMKFMEVMSKHRVNSEDIDVETSDKVQYVKADLDEELIQYYGGCTSLNRPWYSLCLKGKLIIDAYYKEVIPKIKDVISIQKRVSLKNEADDEVYGLLDAVVLWEDGKVYLVDNKTSKVKYDENSVRESNQLALYHYIEKENIKLDGAGFIVLDKTINKNKTKECIRCGFRGTGSHRTCNNIVDGKRCCGDWNISIHPSVDISYFFSKIEAEDEERVLDIFDKVNHGVSNEIFECDNPSKCYTKFGPCPYQKYCQCGDMEGLVDLGEKKENK